MKTDTARTNEREQAVKERRDSEGGTPAEHAPANLRRKVLHTSIAAAIIAFGAARQVGAQAAGASFNDAVITELVTAALDNDRNLSRKDISILTVGRVVYLRGFADTLEQVERAGTLARRVEFVSAVSNAIRVSDRPSRA